MSLFRPSTPEFAEVIALVCVSFPLGLFAQETNTTTALASLQFAPLEFRAPEAVQHRVDPGVEVFFLENHSLPLVSVFARFRGGPSYFSREEQGATTAVPILLRSGGTTDLSPDSVDELLEFYAAQTSFGGGGPSSFSSVNTLTRYLDEVLDVWGSLLREPAFDSIGVEVWRGQQLDNVRRQSDVPARLAISKFNNLLFDDHPVGSIVDSVHYQRYPRKQPFG